MIKYLEYSKKLETLSDLEKVQSEGLMKIWKRGGHFSKCKTDTISFLLTATTRFTGNSNHKREFEKNSSSRTS